MTTMMPFATFVIIATNELVRIDSISHLTKPYFRLLRELFVAERVAATLCIVVGDCDALLAPFLLANQSSTVCAASSLSAMSLRANRLSDSLVPVFWAVYQSCLTVWLGVAMPTLPRRPRRSWAV